MKNLSINRNLFVDGSITACKNLTVKGFLDAPNIRGCSKGLFLTRDDLIANYPRPHRGWWAVVCNSTDSSTAEGELYMALLDEYERPVWTDVGKSVDLSNLIDRFQPIEEELENLNDRIDELISACVLSSEDKEHLTELWEKYQAGDFTCPCEDSPTYEYDTPTLELSYPIIADSGGTVEPALSYKQTWRKDGVEQTPLTSGAVVAFSLLSPYLEGVELNSATGAVSAPATVYISPKENDTTTVANVQLTLTLNGKSTSADVEVLQYTGYSPEGTADPEPEPVDP